MASSNTLSRNTTTAPRSRTQRESSSPSRTFGQLALLILRSALAALASLRLTVVLFFLGIILVLVGTLAQDELDMWTVMEQYFTSWVAWVALDVFFPEAFFPSIGTIPGGFFFPGGALVGAAMFINLLAAHLIRFKIQARGLRLACGSVLSLLGVVFTVFIILSGHNPDGLQAVPIISWTMLWLGVKASLVVLFLTGLAGFAALYLNARNRLHVLAAWGLLGVSALLGLLTFWVFLGGEEMMLSAPSLRILWQLIKATAAGLVLLAGSFLLFKKRGGIVTLHTGIGLLMFGVYYVTVSAVEERIQIVEGETATHAFDIRETELAVIDRSHPEHEEVVVIPQSILLAGDRISHPYLPFDLKLVEHYKNSDLRRPSPDTKNLATAGWGLRLVAEALRPGSGADTDDAVDLASAYVRLLDKENGKPLGTYLVSQVFTDKYDVTEPVVVGGKPYEIALRFKRTYKPYSMSLLDIRKEDYIGTNIARDYSSYVQLEDPSRHVNRNVRIWMNNPLRYAGETFYQSSYGKFQNGKEYTVLQVVTNRGWMIPYVACMIVAVGLLFHFGGTLIRFLNRGTTALVAVTKSPVASESPVLAELAQPKGGMSGWSGLRNWGLPLLMVLIAAGYLAGKAAPPRTADGEMNVHAFGEIPLVYQGRPKPYDTMARNALRIISDRETFVDQEGERQPAIVWLLDVISHSERAGKHRVFRIESIDVLSSLGLERRKGFVYALDEIPMDEVQKQVDLAKAQEDEELTGYQRRILELNRKIQLYLMLAEAHRLPSNDLDGAFVKMRFLQGLAHLKLQFDHPEAQPPLAVPAESAARRWEPLAAAAGRSWVREQARVHEAQTVEQLAEKLISQAGSSASMAALVDQRMFEITKAMVRTANPDMSKQELDQLDEYVRSMIGGLPEEMHNQLREVTRRDIQRQLETAANVMLGAESLNAASDPTTERLAGVLTAYRKGDTQRFNQLVADYQKELHADTPGGVDLTKIRFETFFNDFAPFYYAGILYLLPFAFTALSWLVWQKPLNRTAFWLIVFIMAIHTFALVARIYISGRPPVTNLYSSAVFIGWAVVLFGIVLELIFRLGIGNVVAAVAGFSTLRIAHVLSGDGDTFTVLQAVLDTQFWLATHVVTITLGYAATYAAGLLAVVYIIGGIFAQGLTPDVGRTVARIVSRMIYGILCFAIFFSFVGTVLGGLWADDSWGRFWGWDPKENGALIIVLWNALVLHARWGGIVKERGLAVLAVGGNIVTSWSWFGVNELGLGLHSYGFTEGVLLALGIFVASQIGIMLMAALPIPFWGSWRSSEDALAKAGS